MRISDWSSDVCSSDLRVWRRAASPCWRKNGDACTLPMSICRGKRIGLTCYPMAALQSSTIKPANHPAASRWRRAIDRQSVVSGKSVSVRVDLSGGRIIQKNKGKKNIGIQSMEQKVSYTKKNP